MLKIRSEQSYLGAAAQTPLHVTFSVVANYTGWAKKTGPFLNVGVRHVKSSERSVAKKTDDGYQGQRCPC